MWWMTRWKSRLRNRYPRERAVVSVLCSRSAMRCHAASSSAELGVGASKGGSGSDLALETAEQVEEVEDLLRGVARHSAATLRHDLDDADGLEAPHGVHDGLLADPELGLDLLDRDPRPCRVLAAEQALLELVEDDSPQALACAAHRRLVHVDSFVLDDSHCMG